MKKIFILTIITSFLLSFQASASTQGSYLGINLINTDKEFYSAVNGDANPADKTSYGVSYKYALNFDKIFIAPGIFYNHNNIQNSSSEDSSRTDLHKLKYSYGARLDLGYDVNDKLSPYFLFGHSEGRISQTTDNSNSVQTLEFFFYGLGAKYLIDKNISLNIAYKINKARKSNDIFNATDCFKPEYKVLEFGILYNF